MEDKTTAKYGKLQPKNGNSATALRLLIVPSTNYKVPICLADIIMKSLAEYIFILMLLTDDTTNIISRAYVILLRCSVLIRLPLRLSIVEYYTLCFGKSILLQDIRSMLDKLHCCRRYSIRTIKTERLQEHVMRMTDPRLWNIMQYLHVVESNSFSGDDTFKQQSVPWNKPHIKIPYHLKRRFEKYIKLATSAENGYHHYSWSWNPMFLKKNCCPHHLYIQQSNGNLWNRCNIDSDLPTFLPH